jgi:hypothetical protein
MADDAARDLKDKTPLWTLSFKAGQESLHLTVFDAPDSEATEFPALSSAGPYACTIAKSREESIVKTMDKLLGQKPATK